MHATEPRLQLDVEICLHSQGRCGLRDAHTPPGLDPKALRGALTRLSKLPTPANDGLVRRWRSLVLQTLADGAALHAAALARDRNALIQALAADERASAAYVRLTHRLGFRRCGRTF
jgi:hypothetical protein